MLINLVLSLNLNSGSTYLRLCVCECACLAVGPVCPATGRPLVVTQRNGCVEPLAAPLTEWEAAACADSLSLTPSLVLLAACCAGRKTQGGKWKMSARGR